MDEDRSCAAAERRQKIHIHFGRMSALSQPVKQFTSPSERQQLENLADVYSIIISLEQLEKAYIRDVVAAEEYAPACLKLIGQYKTALSSLGDFDLQKFMREYQVRV